MTEKDETKDVKKRTCEAADNQMANKSKTESFSLCKYLHDYNNDNQPSMKIC